MSGKKSGISIDFRNRRSGKKSGIVPLARLFEPNIVAVVCRVHASHTVRETYVRPNINESTFLALENSNCSSLTSLFNRLILSALSLFFASHSSKFAFRWPSANCNAQFSILLQVFSIVNRHFKKKFFYYFRLFS